MNESKLLFELNQRILKCQRCPLFKNAKNAVPGEGNPKTKIMFIGEAPGKREDLTGRPFIGPAGKLLTKLLSLANLDREKIFITSVVKHWPKKNKTPKLKEIKACNFWLDEQIKIIKPKIIVTLGKIALDKFLPKEKITKIHGQSREIIWQRRKVLLVSMFHPAAGLRSKQVKEKLKNDFFKITKLFLVL